MLWKEEEGDVQTWTSIRARNMIVISRNMHIDMEYEVWRVVYVHMQVCVTPTKERTPPSSNTWKTQANVADVTS